MGLGVRLFQQRKPCLVIVRALCKIQCSRPGLPDLAIFLLCVLSIDIVPDWSLVNRLIVVGGAKIELIIDYTLLPFAVYSEVRN